MYVVRLVWSLNVHYFHYPNYNTNAFNWILDRLSGVYDKFFLVKFKEVS